MKNMKIILVGLLALWIAACSSTGQIQMSQAKTIQLKPNSTAALTVNPPANIPADKKESYQEVVQRLKGTLFGRLMSEGVFQQVSHGDTPSDYRLAVNLLETREVSQGARIFLGVLAGSNNLKVEVTLVEAASGQTVTTFSVEGKSASHPLSSENGMEDAIREVVDEIILALQ